MDCTKCVVSPVAIISNPAGSMTIIPHKTYSSPSTITGVRTDIQKGIKNSWSIYHETIQTTLL
jgi:hypothetical protein